MFAIICLIVFIIGFCLGFGLHSKIKGFLNSLDPLNLFHLQPKQKSELNDQN